MQLIATTLHGRRAIAAVSVFLAACSAPVEKKGLLTEPLDVEGSERRDRVPDTEEVKRPWCDVRLAPDQDAEERARAALERMGTEASMTFAPVRGTPASILGLEIPFPCSGTKEAGASLGEIFASEPDLFRIKPAEWDTSSTSFTVCDAVPETGIWLTWNRRTIGGHPVTADTIAFRLRRKGAEAVLVAVSGHYLPPVSAAVADAMRACPRLQPKHAEEDARARSYPFETFAYCAPTGAGTYEPGAEDAFVLREPYWEWSETDRDVVFESRHRAALRVAPANHTRELLASNANCPSEGKDEVAFAIVFDAVTSTIVRATPGEGCVVCATGGP